MKKIIVISLLSVPLLFSIPGSILSQTVPNPLEGKIIALDAGHGGTQLGAQYPVNSGAAGQIFEKDVNLAVIHALKNKLITEGKANVVLTRTCDETVTSRRSRVNDAIDECKAQYGAKCDTLVSVHHNGNIDPNHDGMLVIYNEKQDIDLANALHDSLWSNLSGDNPNGYIDEGLDNGGYGVTVYGHLVSALTEAYYITNDWEAQQYLAGTSTPICDNNGTDYSVKMGARITDEVNALYQGLYDYFNASGNDGGSNGNECPPGKQRQNKC